MRIVLLPLLLFFLPIQPLWASRGENLLRDGGFDHLPGTAQSPWSVAGTGSVEVGGPGYLGPHSPDRPSVRLVADDAAEVVITQCIAYAALGTPLVFTALSWVDNGGPGSSEAAVRLFPSPGCSGTPSEQYALTGPRGLLPDSFGAVWATNLFPPPSTASIQVSIRNTSTAPGPRRISWDNVRLVAPLDLDQAPTISRVWHQDTEGVADSAEISDGFGEVLAVGDFDRDGYDDLAIGVPGEDRHAFGTDYVDAGLVHVLYGSFDGLRASGSQTLGAFPFNGLQSGARVGAALGAGDINLDGFDDLVVGAPGTNVDGALEAGAIYVAYGSADGLSGFHRITQGSPEIGDLPETGDRFGASIAVGNVDGGHYADVAVGAPGESVGGSGANTGQVYLLYGASDGLQGTGAPRPVQLVNQSGLTGGLEAGAQFGYALAIEDVNLDSYDDLVVGAPFMDGPGTDVGIVFVLFSDLSQVTTSGFLALQPSDFDGPAQLSSVFFGSSLAAGQHLAIYGYGSALLIGASGADDFAQGQGLAYRYVRIPGKPDAFFTLEQTGDTDEAFDQLGWALVSPDLDGDGLPADEVLAAPGEDADTGAVLFAGFNFHGNRMLRQSDIGMLHEPGDRFGAALAHGNFNGRGAEELVVGIPGESLGTTAGAGAVVEIGWDEPLPHIFRNGFEDPQP